MHANALPAGFTPPGDAPIHPQGALTYEAAFLQHHLGTIKYEIFSDRLHEHRCRKSSPSKKEKGSKNFALAPLQLPRVLDFLVKVEVVKEVLRDLLP